LFIRILKLKKMQDPTIELNRWMAYVNFGPS